MDPRQTLVEKLQKHPEIAYKEADGCLRIEALAPNGFALELRNADNEWLVFVGDAGLHLAFNSATEVLSFVAWCYSGAARVRECWRGQWPDRAILEAREEGTWRAVSETRLILTPFWGERRETVLENPRVPLD